MLPLPSYALMSCNHKDTDLLTLQAVPCLPRVDDDPYHGSRYVFVWVMYVAKEVDQGLVAPHGLKVKEHSTVLGGSVPQRMLKFVKEL